MLSKIKSYFGKASEDKKSVLALVGGTTVAQGLNFLFSPIQTRLFSPDVFGELSVFTSITGIIGVIVCLRYELAIMLPREDDEGFALLKLSWLFATLVSVIALIAFGCFGTQIYAQFNANKLEKYWYYVPVTLFLTGVIQAANYWLIRRRQFTVLSYNKVLPVLAVNLVSIGLGFAGDRELDARLFSTLVGNIVNIAVLAWVLVPDIRIKREQQYRKRELVKRYKNFLVYDTWGALLNNLSWMIVPILLNSWFTSFEAGQYSISLRVVQLPMTIIGSAYAQVFFKNASEKYYKSELHDYSKSVANTLLKIIIPVSLVLGIFGKILFRIIFGNEWEMGGRYTQILTFYMLTAFIASPLSTILTVLGKQNIGLLFNFIVLILRILSLFVGRMTHNSYLAMFLFSLTGFFFNLFNIWFFLNVAKKSDMHIAEVNNDNNQ